MHLPRYTVTRLLTASLFALALLLAACGGDTDRAADRTTDRAAGQQGTQLTSFELEHGIGPFTQEVKVSPGIDEAMADRGREIFETSCEACHQMEGRFVGPPLGDVLERRSPTFVMNMIMNPEQMAREHPEGQAMLAQYPVIMPYQNITEEQSREILEYLRTQQR
jgi:cytochrome c